MSYDYEESKTIMNRIFIKKNYFKVIKIYSEYKLLEVLGEGSFSKVFKAQSLKSGNHVAIKCMKSFFNSIQEVKDPIFVAFLQTIKKRLII